MTLGTPRLHFRLTDSTNERARMLAIQGAPHGTLVTAEAQSAGRGRQGRTWVAPPNRAVLCSLVIRHPPPLLPLAAGVAAAETVGAAAQLKWPNDVMVDGRKVAGILAEGRAQEGWAVVGIGINVALGADDLPANLRDVAGSLGLTPADIEPVLAGLLPILERWLRAPSEEVLAAWRERDALVGRPVRWAGGSGQAAGIDAAGRLRVHTDAGPVSIEAGEVHLEA